jgi:probable HAF family extracellular repeat protein
MKLSYPSRIRLAVISLTIAGLANPSLAQLVSFQGLGHLPGAVHTEVSSVSADGSVVVGRSGPDQQFVQAFSWEGGTMTPLGYLDGGVASEAWSTSADGSVTVGVSTSGTVWEAFRSQGGTMSGLDTLGGANSWATGVSGDGSVVVGVSESTVCPIEAFRWEGGLMTPLGTLAGDLISEAVGVSADGSMIVGSSGTDQGNMRACRWEEGVIKDLGYLPDGFTSHALSVSASGSVIVGSVNYNTPDMEAFHWEEGGMTYLGCLPGGFASQALDVSFYGNIVVGESLFSSGSEAFIFIDSFPAMRSVYDVLTDLGLDLTGWTLESCSGISDDGLTLVGNGINPSGQTEAWIATIPEPTTICLLGLGGCWLLRKRRA